MSAGSRSRLGPLLYGLAFCVGLPGLLVLWTVRLDTWLELPTLDPSVARPPGIVLALAGLALVIWSWHAMLRGAGGLPMNAYAPARFTRRGPYAAFDDPIYLGFVALVAGLAVASGSPAGIWIVAPVVALGTIALVAGHERPDLDRRFGADRPRAWLAWPADADRPPTRGERLAVLTGLFVPWLIAYEAIGHMPVPGAFDARLGFERGAPVHPWTEPFYFSVYIVVAIVPWAAARAGDLRRFRTAGVVACGLCFMTYLVVPAISPPRPLEGAAGPEWLRRLMELERSDGLAGRAAMPAFHATWTVLAALVLARAGRGATPIGRTVLTLWSVAAVAACWTTGMHGVLDLVAGGLVAVIAWWSDRIWRGLRRGAEVIAGSWRTWRLGPVRIISHAGWAAGSAALGTAIMLAAGGPDLAIPVLVVLTSAVVGGAVWGQWLEGGDALKRPFGYFGFVLGGGAALAGLAATGVDVPRLAAAIAVAAPWAHAAGRGRCLVQGCCHGAPCRPHRGIIYRHPESRVVFDSGLGGVPLVPTPLWSMVANVGIGLLSLRLWSVGVPAAAMVATYLVLGGLARFVEEGHRGEPRTRLVGGFRIYQVFAAGFVLAGIAISCLPSPAIGGAEDGFAWPTVPGWITVAGAAVLAAVTMGMDFPNSDRRFSRLT